MNKVQLAIGSFCISLFSCSIMANAYTESIVGQWKCLAIVQGEDITPVPSSTKTTIKFEDDGDYIIELDDSVSLSGTWETFDYDIDDADAVYMLNNDDNLTILAIQKDASDDKELYIMIEDIMLYCSSGNSSSSYSLDVSDYSSGSSSSATTGEQNALSKAKSYLSHSAFSYTGLIEQLEYSGYSNSEATYAADHCGANWNEQALKKAKSYTSHSAFSYDGLVEQLEYSGFTHDQAVYGASNCGLSESSAALEKAQSYLSHSAFSYTGLIEQLEYSGFSHEDSVAAADKCGADWYEQAEKKAASYLSHSSFSKSQLISQLEYSGFTHDQAVYGAKQNGYY